MVEKLLNQIQKYLILTGAILFVVFILPGFPSQYHIPKEIFASVIISLALIASLIKSILKGEMKFASGKFDIGVMLLAVAYLLISIFRTPNKMEAFFYPGTTTFVILAAIFYLIINQFSKKSKKDALTALFASGILLSISILFTKLDVFTKIPQLPEFIKDATFNPSGGGLQSVIYLLALLPVGISQIIKEKDAVKKAFFGVASAVLILGIALMGVELIPGKTNTLTLPSWQTSWEITVEALKQNPLLGVGPGNYLSAFNLYRSLSYNQTDLWQIRFSSANNYYFTLVTELGLIGFGALLVLLASIYGRISKSLKSGPDSKSKAWEESGIVILVISLALVPATPALIFLLMAFLAVFSGSEEKSITVATNKVPTIIVAAPIFALIIALGFFGTRAVAAEINYKRSLDALAENNAKATYDYMLKALELNPYVDRYHASMAQVDMALAASLATSENLTENDKQTITQLVQQAISEGKATVTLNIERSSNWEVLAQIYRSIMGFAEGSDQFAIQTYTQAVALDPINPSLRVTLGGVYYALEDYDNAINVFQLATVAKADYANGYYNLAYAYAAKKDFDKAISSMERVISLVNKDSDDYKTAQSALESFKRERPATVESSTESLTQPEAIEELDIEPPITLPDEATPPAATP